MDTKSKTPSRATTRSPSPTASPYVAPTIESVVDGKLDPAQVPDGPKYTIPEWDGMAVGDRLEWFWLGQSVGGQDAGDFNIETVGDVEVTVSRGVLEINANGGDTVTAIYAVTPQGGTREESETTLVEVKPLNDGDTLPPPRVNEAPDGVIDPDDINVDITVSVDPYEGMAEGHTVWIYFGEGTEAEESDNFYISQNYVDTVTEMYVPKAKVEFFKDSTVTVYYKVEKIKGSGVFDVSDELTLIVGEPETEPRWPAPYVEEADGDYLPEEAYQRGIRTVVPLHADMQANDVVDLYWGEPGDDGYYPDRVVIGVPESIRFRLTKDKVDPWLGRIAPVRYTITRGSTVIRSEVLKLGVGIEPQKMPAPTMAQVNEAGELNLGALTKYADVTVPVYEGMSSGDRVWIDWGPGSGNGDDGLTLANHVSDETEGKPIDDAFEVVALRPFVGQTVPVTYRVEGNLVNDTSDALLVTVVDAGLELAPPRIPAVVDGKLDPRQVAGGAEVVVPFDADHMELGNTIRLRWRSTNADADFTQEKPVGGGAKDIEFTVPFDIVDAGLDSTVTVTYDLIVNDDVVASGAAIPFVIEQSELPAVVMTDANEGNLNPDDVPADGATVRIDETALFALDDIVTVYWKGATDYQVPAYTIKASDVGNAIELRIPKATVEQSNGTVVEVKYSILRKASGFTEDSPPATYEVGRELAQGDLIVLGARNRPADMRNSGGSKYLRAVSADKREDIIAEWRYDGDTASKSGASFLDSEPWRLLHVRTETASTSILPAHVAGSGIDANTATGTAAFGVLMSTGAPYAWGNGLYGGDIDPAFMGMAAVELSTTHHAIAARLADGNAVMWGNPANGAPDMPYPANVAHIVGNLGAFAYIRKDGTLGAWGNAATAGVVEGDALTVTDADRIIANSHAFCCLRKDGKMVPWGTVANGGVIDDLMKKETVTDVLGSTQAFCALRPNHTLIAWGLDTNGGKLEDDVALARDITELAAATSAAFAVITEENKVMAWGNELFGGKVSEAVKIFSDIVEVVANTRVFCARRANGQVITWGPDKAAVDYGHPMPVDVALAQFVQVAASSAAFAGLKRDGTVMVWGDPARGGDASAVAHLLVDIRAIYANSQGFAAIPSKGGIVSWGVAAGGGTPTPQQQENLDRYVRYEVKGSAIDRTSPQGRALTRYQLRRAVLESA
ncbi:hypothetical protein PCA31118_04402 [Pandoraea captiosa]|uniref:Uncharacterized protein n=1 Tax=Pandoraea captiosa TaxID=2508302 RepID=A0A5E5ALS1_9BURK|nr:hypothetical protein [Pandoraea captiosa]VVE73040.1 hypothetical protein PCA31118_04402 [Pandoraea captiosa]